MVRIAATLAILGALGCGGGDDDTPAKPEPEPPTPAPTADVTYPPARIGFGSCSDQTIPMTMLDVAASLEPELYLWLGDNVYADTEDMANKQLAYNALAALGGFQALAAKAEFLATWDDHDYGRNDVGADYTMKAETKEIFLDFWKEPEESPRRQHEGIYHSVLYPGTNHTLQVILLDTRTFRGPLTPNDGSGVNDYVPTTDESVTILGEAQWAWLEEQLKVPADLRLIASSIQLVHEYNGWESWTNVPHERERMFDLIRSTRANGVIVLSGDVHWGEFSKIELEPGWPLYDLTSSGINKIYPILSPNANRVGEAWVDYHVGLLDIDWAGRAVHAALHDITGTARRELTIPFDELTPPEAR